MDFYKEMARAIRAERVAADVLAAAFLAGLSRQEATAALAIAADPVGTAGRVRKALGRMGRRDRARAWSMLHRLIAVVPEEPRREFLQALEQAPGAR